MSSTTATILLIEDSQVLRELVLEILEIENYAVLVAVDGEEGLRLAREVRPDLILCDISMPKMNGHELLRALRADPATARLPFIFITAKAERSELRAGMNLGADDYLTKPFGADELLSAVRTRLQQKGSGRTVPPFGGEITTGDAPFQLPPAIRTSLSGILGLAQLLSEAEFSREERDAMMSEIRASARRLERGATNAILHLELKLARSSPQRAQALLRREPVSLSEVIHAAVAAKSREYEREIETHLEPGPDCVTMDFLGLRKAVDELLDNACQSALKTGRVTITTQRKADVWLLNIDDDGAGMTSELIQQVLAVEPPDHDPRQMRGLGLGLPIARNLIELSGGKLSLESNRPTGLRVTVSLPAAPE